MAMSRLVPKETLGTSIVRQSQRDRHGSSFSQIENKIPFNGNVLPPRGAGVALK